MTVPPEGLFNAGELIVYLYARINRKNESKAIRGRRQATRCRTASGRNE